MKAYNEMTSGFNLNYSDNIEGLKALVVYMNFRQLKDAHHYSGVTDIKFCH